MVRKLNKQKKFVKLLVNLPFLFPYLLRPLRDTIRNIMKKLAAMESPAIRNIIPEASSGLAWHSTCVPFVPLISRSPEKRGPPMAEDAPLDPATIL